MEKRISRIFFYILLLYLVLGLFMPLNVHSEFYRYVDKDGKVHYVDDISRIPPEYRDVLEKYQERYDNLSDSERTLLREKEDKKAQENQLELIEQIRKRQEARRKRQQEQRVSKKLATRVTIRGNHALLPVEIGYGTKKAEALLVLDTGAEVTVIHKEIANRLNIRNTKTGYVTVAGGQKVKVGVVELDYIQAGPHQKTNLAVVIMPTEGPLHYNGLLGMDFLRGLEYSIDFEEEVIRWKP